MTGLEHVRIQLLSYFLHRTQGIGKEQAHSMLLLHAKRELEHAPARVAHRELVRVKKRKGQLTPVTRTNLARPRRSTRYTYEHWSHCVLDEALADIFRHVSRHPWWM